MSFGSSAVFAYSEIGYVSLEALLSMGADVRVVFTHEDDPQEEIWFRSVAALAKGAGIPVFTLPPPAASEKLLTIAPDMIFSFYYRKIIPPEIISAPPGGAYNLHGSLLPRYRGRAPVNWAIINGETETGVTLHHMTKEADKGDIVDQEVVPIGFSDTARDLYTSLAEAAKAVILRSYPLILSGVAPRRKQDESLASTFPRRTPADGKIDWNRGAREIYNLIRGVTHPFPGAFTNLCKHGVNHKVMIWRAFPLEALSTMGEPPGTVLSLAPLTVATGKGALRIESLQVEGRDTLASPSFVGALGIKPKTRFGDEPHERGGLGDGPAH